MQARIFKPARTAMQQGRAKTNEWMLEYEQQARRVPDRLMGWTSSTDTTQQVRIFFETKEEAVAFAEKNGIPYTLIEPHERKVRPKSYADNFRWDRVR